MRTPSLFTLIKKGWEGKRATKLWGREKNMINQRFELSPCSRPSKSRQAGAFGGRRINLSRPVFAAPFFCLSVSTSINSIIGFEETSGDCRGGDGRSGCGGRGLGMKKEETRACWVRWWRDAEALAREHLTSLPPLAACEKTPGRRLGLP